MRAHRYDQNPAHVHVIVIVHGDHVRKFNPENINVFPEMMGVIEAVE
jgi:hypothetical protein